MKIYIKNLLERLVQFSERIDNTTLFVEKQWVLIDENNNHQTFIFERNGDLVMSLNGKVKMGKWKYYQEARSIRIDRITDQILLNQAFFDNAVMILKHDGSPDEDLFVFVDKNKIPDLDVKKYLQSVIGDKINVSKRALKNSRILEIHRGNNSVAGIGMKVTIDYQDPLDGEYLSDENDYKYVIKNGVLSNIVYLKNYRCNTGVILSIEQKDGYKLLLGDFVFIGTKFASPGKYKIGLLNYITVEDGVIVKKSWF